MPVVFAIQSDPTNAYSIQVSNPMPHAMVVSYNDGRAPAMLGTVGPGATERFIVASPASTTIAITATDAGNTHRVGPISVMLSPSATAQVTLR